MLSSIPSLSALIFLPLIAGIIILSTKEQDLQGDHNARWVALFSSVIVFLVSLIIAFAFDGEKQGYQYTESLTLYAPLNMTYSVGIDGISLCLVLLTNALTIIAILASWRGVTEKVKPYMFALLMLETCILGVFCATDLLLFYIFFEAALIPSFLMIGIWGGPQRIETTIKFFIYTLAGSILMLVSILYIYVVTGTFLISDIQNFSFTRFEQSFLWLGFFASFAIKIPMWPLHTWLPAAYREAPLATTIMLAALLGKTGAYGLLRLILPFFPDACQLFGPMVRILSLIAIVYTSITALVQKDLKNLIAYSSIAHMGFVTFGLFSFSFISTQGAIFQMISHAFIIAGLFICINIAEKRLQNCHIDQLGGLVQKMPFYAFFLMIFVLASVALPGTSGFIGELYVLMGAFRAFPIEVIIAASTMVLGAAYGLWFYRRIAFDTLPQNAPSDMKDINLIDKWTLAPLAVVIIVLGLCPTPVFSTIESSVSVLTKKYLPQPTSSTLNDTQKG